MQNGFDGAKTGLGLMFVLMATLFILVFITAGAMFMRAQERKAREARDGERPPESS